jgi:hypothetical protein
MAKICYKLILVTDAEPGSGFGTELINAIVPRDNAGRPILPASHLKGLMKDNVLKIAEDIDNQALKELLKKVFGTPGDTHCNRAGIASFSDAKTNGSARVLTVTRTSLNESGTALDSSLRTTEAIAVGTVFSGTIYICGEPDKGVDLLLRLALLSLDAVGGSRNRGCGGCYVEIEGEYKKPGTVLQELLKLLTESPIAITKTAVVEPIGMKARTAVILKMIFEAEAPICLPETPIVGNNTIQSGFTIPASAVQGMILHRLNQFAPEIADECFENPFFRTWPLHPTFPGNRFLPIRVSTTHCISKLPDNDGRFAFRDTVIEPYDWREVPHGAPLKAADGVLIPADDGSGVWLWRAGDMARIITAHAVHDDKACGRNLFTVESMAPQAFSGIISLPENAAMFLMELLNQDNFVRIGKARSIRGGGRLKVERAAIDDCISQEALPARLHNGVFIVQSPLLIPDEWQIDSANAVLIKLVQDAGWDEVCIAGASISVLFGWNRHGKGVQIEGKGRLRAQRVIAPGSIFKLKKTVSAEKLQELLIAGIGKGKNLGYGAILPHPGIADKCYTEEPRKITLKSQSMSGKIGFELWMKGKNSGLSASQINFFRNKLRAGKENGLGYLSEIKNRPLKIWNRWNDIMDDIKKNIDTDYETALKSIKVWHDLVVAEGGSNE